MKFTKKTLLSISTIVVIMSSCNSNIKKDTIGKETVEPDSLRYERLRIEDAERNAKIEATMEKVYHWSDTIPFGDLSIKLDKVKVIKTQSSSTSRSVNELRGYSEYRSVSLTVTFINNGTETLALPYAHFAKGRSGKKNKAQTNTIRGTTDSDFYTASRLMQKGTNGEIISNMNLNPKKKIQVTYLSVLNKTSQWLLRFTNEQPLDYPDSPDHSQIQKKMDDNDATIITEEYEGTSAYVDLNEIL